MCVLHTTAVGVVVVFKFNRSFYYLASSVHNVCPVAYAREINLSVVTDTESVVTDSESVVTDSEKSKTRCKNKKHLFKGQGSGMPAYRIRERNRTQERRDSLKSFLLAVDIQHNRVRADSSIRKRYMLCGLNTKLRNRDSTAVSTLLL